MWLYPQLPRSGSPSRRHAAFSLVEMLAVMAIIAILLSLVVPALNSFGSTFGRRGAVNTVMNTMEQARVAALEAGRPVYVVFRRSQYPEPDAIMVLREPDPDAAQTTPGAGSPARYEGLTRWIKLPKGVLLHNNRLANILSPNISASSFDEARSPVKLSTTNGEKYNVLAYNPSGGVSFPADDLVLFISEGVRGANDTEALISARKEQTGFEIISLRRFTGRASLEVTAL